MAKIITSSPFIEKIWKNTMLKIKNPDLRVNGEKVVKIFQFDGRPVHAGQLWSKKLYLTEIFKKEL